MSEVMRRVTKDAELDAQLIQAVARESAEKKLSSAVDAFNSLPGAFNAIRLAVNEAHIALKDHFKLIKDFNKIFGSYMGIGVTDQIRAIGCKPEQIESDTSFIELITKIGSQGDPLAKMKSLCGINKKIDERIKDWESKEAKLSMRHDGDGATDAEREIIAKKLDLLRSTIALLRKRGDTVSEMYYSAKKFIEREIAEINNQFTPKFATKEVV